VRALLLLCLGVTAGCSPGSFGAKAVELGIVPQASTIQGRDGGQSGLVWGRSVWTFGDTVLNQNDAAGSNWHHNSFSITDDLVGRDGLSGFTERTDAAGAPDYLLAPSPDEASFNDAHRGDPCMTTPCGARWAVWPGRPVWDADRSRAILFYGLIYADPGGFHGLGQSVALWNDLAQAPERPILSTGVHPTLLFQQNEPAWGTAALIDAGMLHVFACDTDGNGFSPPCYLAQVAPEQVTDRSAWRFWSGESWSTSMSDKRELFSGAPTISVAFNDHLKQFAAIYCEPLSNHVVIRTAPALTGPWSEAKLLFDANKDPEGAYDSNWHGELDDGADLYVTFSRSNHQGLFGSELALVRVTLP
jgi:hypothetical protein